MFGPPPSWGPPAAGTACPPRLRRAAQGIQQAAGALVVGLGALADLAGPYLGNDAARLPRPAGEPADERRRLEAAKVSADGRTRRGTPAVCGFETPPVGHAQAVRLTLAAAVEQAAA